MSALPFEVVEADPGHARLLDVREMAVQIAGRLIVSNVTFSVDAGEILADMVVKVVHDHVHRHVDGMRELPS